MHPPAACSPQPKRPHSSQQVETHVEHAQRSHTTHHLVDLSKMLQVGGATCLKLAKDFTVALPSAMLFVFYGVMLLLLCTFFTT